MSGMALPITLKRVLPFSERIHRMSIAHLPENREMTFLTGHVSNYSYFNVSDFRFCKLLFIRNKRFNFALSKRKYVSFAKLIINFKT